MSHNYDNWERLVDAVLKRELYLQLSFRVSTSTDDSDSSSSNFSSSFRSQIEEDDPREEFQLTEQFSPGVYITVKARGDGTNELLRIRMSRRRYNNEREVEAWWSENRDRVYEEYRNKRLSMYEPQPGVHLTVSSTKEAGNKIQRVQFSRRKFSKEQAEAWWAQNREMIRRRYDVTW